MHTQGTGLAPQNSASPVRVYAHTARVQACAHDPTCGHGLGCAHTRRKAQGDDQMSPSTGERISSSSTHLLGIYAPPRHLAHAGRRHARTQRRQRTHGTQCKRVDPVSTETHGPRHTGTGTGRGRGRGREGGRERERCEREVREREKEREIDKERQRERET